MIERTVVASKIREYQIGEFVEENLRRVGHSHTTLQRTPLGEKVVVHASRPGLVVGRQGESIKKLTNDLKAEFNLENPQVEVQEVKEIYLNANIVAEMIASSLERFGTKRFKATMHRSLANIMRAGALGAEIVLSGKLPSKRARTWRVYKGHLKKSGDVKVEGVRTAYTTAELKSGSIGVQVRIMPPDLKLPDRVEFKAISGPEEKTPETASGSTAEAAREAEEIADAEEVLEAEPGETGAEKTEADEKPVKGGKPAAEKPPETKPEEEKPANAPPKSESSEEDKEKKETGGDKA